MRLYSWYESTNGNKNPRCLDEVSLDSAIDLLDRLASETMVGERRCEVDFEATVALCFFGREIL